MRAVGAFAGDQVDLHPSLGQGGPQSVAPLVPPDGTDEDRLAAAAGDPAGGVGGRAALPEADAAGAIAAAGKGSGGGRDDVDDEVAQAHDPGSTSGFGRSHPRVHGRRLS